MKTLRVSSGLVAMTTRGGTGLYTETGKAADLDYMLAAINETTGLLSVDIGRGPRQGESIV